MWNIFRTIFGTLSSKDILDKIDDYAQEQLTSFDKIYKAKI